MRDYGMAAAEDEAIFELAARDERVIVSADTDFGALLSLCSADRSIKQSSLNLIATFCLIQIHDSYRDGRRRYD
ncbi:MAG: DUF5615 family PIN-like protein [Methylocella sp.]